MNKAARRAVRVFAVLALVFVASDSLWAQESSKLEEAKKPAESKEEVKREAPRSKSGKKLLTAMDVLRVSGIGEVKLSPDGLRVAYVAREVKLEKDKEWDGITQVWVALVAGPSDQARQYTRGAKSATYPRWSPDGRYLAFLTNREKESEQQVWFMWADGGEARQVTTHKGGVTGFEFAPDGKKLLLLATEQPSKEEEEKKKRSKTTPW